MLVAVRAMAPVAGSPPNVYVGTANSAGLVFGFDWMTWRSGDMHPMFPQRRCHSPKMKTPKSTDVAKPVVKSDVVASIQLLEIDLEDDEFKPLFLEPGFEGV